MSASVFALVLAQCETHARRMLWAKHTLRSVLPLNSKQLHVLDDLDAYLDKLNRAFAAADRLVEILRHVKGFAARYDNK